MKKYIVKVHRKFDSLEEATSFQDYMFEFENVKTELVVENSPKRKE